MNVDDAGGPIGRRVGLPPGLLSVEESAQFARTLRAWPVSLHIALATRVVEIARQWAECWELPGPFDVLSSHCDETGFDGRDPIAAEPWNAVLADSSTASLWWATSMNGVPVSPQRLLSAAMFDETGSSAVDDRMADALMVQAWQDWCERLTNLFEPEARLLNTRPVSPTAFPVLDGAVLTRVSWLGGELRLIIGGDSVQSWATANGQVSPSDLLTPRFALAPRVPLLHALGDQSVPLYVELSRVTVDVGALIALEVGDVLCTAHPLASPLTVRAMGAEPSSRVALSAGYLGARDGWRAVELTEMRRHL